MKTLFPALAVAAILGFAAPAAAHDGAPRGIAVQQPVKAQDFSSRHRHGHWNRHHRRHHVRHCTTFWRHGHLVRVCR